MTKWNKSFFLILLFFIAVTLPIKAEDIESSYDKLFLSSVGNYQEHHNGSLNFCTKKSCTHLKSLDGIWVLRKKTIKRTTTLLQEPITFVHCNSRLPFELRDVEREVLISQKEPSYFLFTSVFPITDEIYYDQNHNTQVTYKGLGLKGVLDPEDLTYAYTLNLVNHLEHKTRPRQIWINGRIMYESLSNSRIKGKGYEILYTPECGGFVKDEIKFELIKKPIICALNVTS